MASKSLRYSYSVAALALGFSKMLINAKYTGNPPPTFMKMHNRLEKACHGFLDAYGPETRTMITDRDAKRIAAAYEGWKASALPDGAKIPTYTAACHLLLADLWVDVAKSKNCEVLRAWIDKIQAALKAMHEYYDRRGDDYACKIGMNAAEAFKAQMDAS